MRPYYEDDVVAIYHGDCREILPDMPPVDLVLTDPPYGIGYDSTHTKYLEGLDYGIAEWDRLPFEPRPLLLLDTKLIIWGGNCFASRLPDSPGWLSWVKILRDGSAIRQADFELAWTNCIRRSQVFHHLWIGNFRESESGVANYHPTQKPLALMKWCIGLVKNVGSVLDPYMGSGTTLRAAKDLGIRAIGIEINEAYCEVAAKRMAQEVFQFNGLAKIESKGPELFVI